MAAEWGSVEVERSNDNCVGVLHVMVLERDIESVCNDGFVEIVCVGMRVGRVICGRGSEGGLDGKILFIYGSDSG